MSLSEKIAAKQEQVAEARDVLEKAVTALEADESNEDLQNQVEAATEAVEKQDAELARLKDAEDAIQKSLSRQVSSGDAPAISTNPAARMKDDDKADLLVKSAVCAFDAYIKRVPVEQVVAERYGDDEVVKAVVSATTKATQNPAMTTVPAWAGSLVRESYAGFMDLLRGESVVPQIPMHRYDFGGSNKIHIPNRTSQNPDLHGAFRKEGDPIRVGALALGSTALTPKSMGVIGTWTQEMFERSNPNIEGIVRDAMIQDTAYFLDGIFLGTAAAVTGVQPAGIGWYATATGGAAGNTAAATGTTPAAMMTDIRARVQAMTAANLGRRPVWVMNPANWYGIKLQVTAAGTPVFPEAVTNNVLLGIPVVTSTSVPATNIYLIDAAEVYFAGGAPRFMGTEVATLHEENQTPLPIVDDGGPPATTAHPVRSLYQTNSAALRCVWELDWAVMRTGAVQTITSANY